MADPTFPLYSSLQSLTNSEKRSGIYSVHKPINPASVSPDTPLEALKPQLDGKRPT
ncbi:MAG: hypothetical protein NZ989_08870 [Bacteroidia bacterium]|nr:hypothetical protein [Bacteroidia bacterium]MDW8058424.1 hypothetical protein [Bacteroidia bacterium]